MRLTVSERLTLLNILPIQGDFITLKLIRKLREALSFSEQEVTYMEFKYNWKCPKCEKAEISLIIPKCPECDVYMEPAGQVTWDEEKASTIVKDVHMGENMLVLCKNTLKRLSDEEKLEERHMSLYEKFVEGKDEE